MVRVKNVFNKKTIQILYLFSITLMFGLILLSFYTDKMDYLFQDQSKTPFEVKTNEYGHIVVLLILVVWGLYHFNKFFEYFEKYSFAKSYILFLKYLVWKSTFGLDGINKKNLGKHILYGGAFGLALGILTKTMQNQAFPVYNPVKAFALMIFYPPTFFHPLLIAPLLEEIIFRGIFLGLATKLFKDKKNIWPIALIQAIIFTFIHPVNVMIKIIPILAFTTAYMINPKENIKTCIAMHAGTNLMAILTV